MTHRQVNHLSRDARNTTGTYLHTYSLLESVRSSYDLECFNVIITQKMQTHGAMMMGLNDRSTCPSRVRDRLTLGVEDSRDSR